MKRQQGELLPMVKFREIIRLHELGYSQCEIAQSCAIARSTVQDYIRRATSKGLTAQQLNQLSDSEAQSLLGKGQRQAKPTRETINFSEVEVELRHKGVTLALLWQEGLETQRWQCSYGTFCRRYKQWRGEQKLSMRQVYRGGDKAFVDYCGVTLKVHPPETGEAMTAQIFVGCLGASNYTYAEATTSQGLSQWLGSQQRMVEFFGGVPACIVPDNLKSGVTDAHRYEPGVNPSYQEWASHYGLAILPARPYKPRDKAKVEKAVQEVERQILAPLRQERFTSFTTLNQAIKAGVERLNQRQMRDYQQSRAQLFEGVDKPALKPLPQMPFVFARWKQTKVGPDYHIKWQHHYYSVPYWFVQRQVQVKASEQLIEVFHEHKRIACHPRSALMHQHTTLPEHMPPEHWAYKNQSQETFMAWAQQVGEHTTAQVKTIFARQTHPEQAFRTLKGLQGLAQRFSSQRLEAACRRANHFGMVGMRRIRAILEASLDQAPLPPETLTTPGPNHPNVRGSLYYA